MRTFARSQVTLPLLLAAALMALAVAASTASAVIVKFPGGKTYSYQPLRGAALRFDSRFTNLDYNGGPVMASNTNYLIFWSRSGPSAYGSSEYATGLETYLSDLAHDSGGSQNTDSVSAQYNDAAGNFASYKSTYGGALIDTDPYPASQCPVSAPSTNCLVDFQLQTELGKFLDANHLPRDLTHEYFLISPPHVESCFNNDPSNQPQGGPYGGCSAGAATNPSYCAYHGNSFIPPAFIYANDPYVTGNLACDDGNHPNGPSDGALEGGLSHEHNESITDPLPNDSWTDIGSSVGGEIGDKCAGTMGAELGTHNVSPYNQVINGHFYWYQEEWSNQGHTCLQRFTPSGTAPTAQFSSTTGANNSLDFDASASTGPVAQYNWQFNDSPGLGKPAEQPTPTINHTFPSSSRGSFVVGLTVFEADGTSAGTSSIITPGKSGPTPGFSASAIPVAVQPVSFSALPTLGGDSVIDYFWDFGDGSAAGSGATPSHTYSVPGANKVTLTMWGIGGGVVTSQQVTVDEPPSASFFLATPRPVSGLQTAFNGSASSDSDGSIVSYSWNFGDGSAGSGATPSHVYTADGTYTVSLTVTDSSGAHATTSQQVSVDESPTASIHVRTKHPSTGSAVRLDGSFSDDVDGSIVSYSWNYGDGAAAGSGPSSKHTYKKHGTYEVTLTVTDSSGIGASATASVAVVKAARIKKVSVKDKRGTFYLLVKVTGPGRVKLGRRTVRLTNAGTAQFKLSPDSHHKLKLKLKFTPVAGAVQRKTVTARFP